MGHSVLNSVALAAALTGVLGTSLHAECTLRVLYEPVEAEGLAMGREVLIRNTRINQERSGALFRFDDMALVPNLVSETWFDTEAGRVYLRTNPQCRWSDGQPITAEDIRAGFYNMFGEHADKVNYTGRRIFQNADAVLEGAPLDALGIEIVDSETVSFPTDTSYDIVKRGLTDPYLGPAPTHKIAENPEYWTSFDHGWISSGPFVIEEITAERAVLTQNPYYCWKDRPNFERVELLFAEEGGEMLDLMLNGDIHFHHQEYLGDWLNDGPFALDELRANYRVEEVFLPVVEYLHFNTNREALDDLEIRQALVEALEFELFSDPLQLVSDPAPVSFLVPFLADHPDLDLPSGSREARLESAVRRLNQAGYTEENPLRLKMLSRTSRPRSERFGNMVVSMLAMLPIEVEVILTDNTGDFYTQLEDPNHPYDLYLTSLYSERTDTDSTSFISNLLTYFDLTPAELEAAMDQFQRANAENDTEKRQELLRGVVRTLVKNRVITPLFVENEKVVLANSVRLSEQAGSQRFRGLLDLSLETPECAE